MIMIPKGIEVISTNKSMSERGIYVLCIIGSNPTTQQLILAFIKDSSLIAQKYSIVNPTEKAIREALAEWEIGGI